MFKLLLIACAILTASASAQNAPPPAGAPELRFVVQGAVLDDQNRPVSKACVIILSAKTGLPFTGPDFAPFESVAAARGDEALNSLQYATTDQKGEFTLRNVPKGAYRIIAQRWQLDFGDPGPLDVHSRDVQLFASAEPITITEDTNSVRLRPEGACTLTVEVESQNDQTLLIVSTAPTRADPVLAFAGWSGPFMQHIIAWNRMPKGRTTFHNLPQTTVHVAVFAADNVPGFGAGAVELKNDADATINIPWVAPWSNAMQQPPPSLEPVIDILHKRNIDTTPALLDLLEQKGVHVPRPRSPLAALTLASGVIDEQVQLDDQTGQMRVGDLLAAAAYIGIGHALEKQNREPNPWREPAITYAPANPSRDTGG